MDEKEFHCKGEFKAFHKGRPNEDDLKAAAELTFPMNKILSIVLKPIVSCEPKFLNCVFAIVTFAFGADDALMRPVNPFF